MTSTRLLRVSIPPTTRNDLNRWVKNKRRTFDTVVVLNANKTRLVPREIQSIRVLGNTQKQVNKNRSAIEHCKCIARAVRSARDTREHEHLSVGVEYNKCTRSVQTCVQVRSLRVLSEASANSAFACGFVALERQEAIRESANYR